MTKPTSRLAAMILISSLASVMLTSCVAETTKTDISPQVTAPEKSSAPPAETEKPQEVKIVEQVHPVNVGEYRIGGYASLYWGTATVIKIGVNQYSLSAERVVGHSYANGSIEVDFSLVGDRYIGMADDQKIELTFTENSVSIDYKEDTFGGMNAEPKGVYYLTTSYETDKDTSFIDRIYSLFVENNLLSEEVLGDVSDFVITTYPISSDLQVLLVQTKWIGDYEEPTYGDIVFYHPDRNSLEYVGNVTEENTYSTVSKVLEDDDLTYEIVNKRFYDEFVLIEDEHLYEDGYQEGQPWMTEDEASYIIAGSKDPMDYGPYEYQALSSNDTTIWIAKYFLTYTNIDDESESTSTLTDVWSVDRVTGRVTYITDWEKIVY